MIKLAPQQKKVCDLLLKDMNIREIAEKMNLTETTVKMHIMLAKRKYEVKTLAGLAAAHCKAKMGSKDVG